MVRFFSLEIVLVIFMCIGGAKLCVRGSNNSRSYLCDEGDRETLLKFQKSVRDPYHKLSSWENTTDCCMWKGIGCDTKTGRVLKLDLGKGMRYQPLYLVNMTSCLAELKCLEYLDLSGNDFYKHSDFDFDDFIGDPKIPQFLGLIQSLTYLNLSDMGFGNFIPPQLGNLTNLEVLDLSGNIELGGARNLLQELSVLPSLSVLGLSRCYLNNSHFHPSHINSTFLSSIQELYIGGNNFSGPLPRLLENMTSLRVLDISTEDNSLFKFENGSIPVWLENLKSLEHLDLSFNNFVTIEGGLSRMLRHLCHLKSLNLYQNQFHDEFFETNIDDPSVCMNGYDLEILNMAYSGLKGYFPNWLGQFSKLTNLNLSNNRLHGRIPASIGDLQALKILDLSNNHQLNGVIPVTLGNLLSLEVLHLSNNKLNGSIPATIGNLIALTNFDVSHNQLSGGIPESIGQLSALKNMDFSSNLLQGEISAIHFSKLSVLKELRFGSNQMSINIRPNWAPPFQLTHLHMGSCNIIGTVFPRWLESQKEVTYLVVSNATISGPLPKWFQASHLRFLDLSLNQITGHIPQDIDVLFPSLESVQLSHNMFNGTIPSSFCKLENIRVLDLSDNKLSGDIPDCWIWRDFQILHTIRLSSNKLTGVIPSSFGNLQRLSWLHLNNNGLKGNLPRSLSFTRIVMLNVGENKLSGNVPKWIGTDMWDLQILRLRKNMFDGLVPHQLCSLENLKILDLAGNNLNGTIPPCLGNLTGMILKPKKELWEILPDRWEDEKIEVVIKAKNTEYTKILQLVVNLDLSSNKLVGTIPNELSYLIELLGLNLSYNHLTGHIPNSIGDMKSLMSLDLSNNQLYGEIPTSMSDLSLLAYLNLSQNNLSGRIPSGHQLQTLEDPSIYTGNPKLCGDPLPKICLGDEPFRVPVPAARHDKNKEDDDDDKSDKLWLYMVITLGYATGLWVVLGTLMLKKNWRYAYFRFADETMDWIYVTILINYARLKKKMIWGKGF